MERVGRLFNRKHGLEDGAFAVLNPLAHGVEVCREVDRGREDALAVFAFALTVELLPPFAHEMELRLEVGQDFDFLSGAVDGVANGGILGGDVFLEGNIGASGFFHVGSTLHELVDVEASAGDGEQADGGENAEASAHVVGDDEALVAFLVGGQTGSALLGVGDGNDDLAGHFFAALFFTLLLEQAEGQGRFSGGAAL